MIDPATVESVEFTPRINVLYGSQGAFGVIAVYTKTGSSPNTAITPNFQQLLVKGFDRPRNFTAPDYGDKAIDLSKPDYRATLYWNPQISTSSSSGIAAVSFFSADLPGRYRVVVEGITQAGEPIRAVTFIEVESN